MIEIENLSLDEWYICLKPYQRNIISQFVADFGEEVAAEKWLTARGPIQTATFGGDLSKNDDTKTYWSRLRDEFDKLVCGHADYKEERKKILAAGKTIGIGSVTALANWFAPIVCISSPILVPAIILLLHTTSKMGVKAYCANKNL